MYFLHCLFPIAFALIIIIQLTVSAVSPEEIVVCVRGTSVPGSNNRCEGTPFNISTTKRECCMNDGMFYTTQTFDPGRFFRFRIVKQGIPDCYQCSETRQNPERNRCSDMDCGPDRYCKARFQKSKCVCRRTHQRCSTLAISPVCGTNGKTYQNMCFLERRACSKQNRVTVAYRGPCNDNCVNVTCPTGQSCVVDQYNKSHCVSNCSSCNSSPADTEVCGADGVTYGSLCRLRVATCKLGKTIGVAYLGSCKGSDCSTVKCSRHKRCLTDETGQPRCTSCHTHFNCRRMSRPQSQDNEDSPRSTEICGTDGRTYSSFCALREHSCNVGRLYSIKHIGRCYDKDERVKPSFSERQSDGRSRSPRVDKILNFFKNASFDIETLKRALLRLGFSKVHMTHKKKTRKISLKALICLMYPRNDAQVIHCN
ncbi:follistatin-A isoform X2 [Nematostella vectensis]|uniref:follistatin-A isoform X2 n=1 Tax=Nematostella vectensis TaxID=45351 RepID=UPI0020774A34|nr:follistatin-A isoform X2 [Nematostella vectensis]